MTEEILNTAFDLSDKIRLYEQVRETLCGENVNLEHALSILKRTQPSYDDDDTKELEKYMKEASEKIRIYVDIVIERTKKQFAEL